MAGTNYLLGHGWINRRRCVAGIGHAWAKQIARAKGPSSMRRIRIPHAGSIPIVQESSFHIQIKKNVHATAQEKLIVGAGLWRTRAIDRLREIQLHVYIALFPLLDSCHFFTRCSIYVVDDEEGCISCVVMVNDEESSLIRRLRDEEWRLLLSSSNRCLVDDEEWGESPSNFSGESQVTKVKPFLNHEFSSRFYFCFFSAFRQSLSSFTLLLLWFVSSV